MEQHVLILSMILNLIITIIKIVSGIVFSVSSLISDGLHSLCDCITNLLSLIATRVSKKRANKKYPFGYGRIEYITNLLIGVIIFLLGIYIFVQCFKVSNEIPDIKIIFLVLLILFIKFVVVIVLNVGGKKLKSNTLISNAKESIPDFYSSILVFITAILLQFSDKLEILKYSNNICNIFICFLVFRVSYKIIRDNFVSLLGKSDNNTIIKDKLSELLNSNSIELKNITLIKLGTYYQVSIDILLNKNLNLKKAFDIQNNIKKQIKNLKLNIKYIDINIEPNN